MLVFEIQEEKGCKVIRVGESITHENVQDFSGAVDRLIDEGCTEIVLDLSEVPYITSKGLGAIVASFTVLRKLGGNLVLVCPQEDVARSLRVTKVDRILDVTATVEEAISLLRTPQDDPPKA